MILLKSIFTLGLLALAQAGALPGHRPTRPGQSPGHLGCGDVDVIFTGLPPNHPLVLQQGFDPAVVNASIRRDSAEIVAAGYNLRVVLMGAEAPIEKLEEQMKGIRWDGTGVGYGVRGARLPDLTIRLEDIIALYRDKAPQAPIMFNYSPDSALWALQRRFPLAENCTDKPGKDLGFEIICDVCEG